MRLTMSNEEHARLLDNIRHGHERISFLFARPSPDNPIDLHVADRWHLNPDTDYIASTPLHLEVADHVRPQVLKRAHDSATTAIEAHWHGGSRAAQFSTYDIDELRLLVPQVLWRLPDRPYVALVFAEKTFDALTWRRADSPTPLDTLCVEGHDRAPSGATLEALAAGYYDQDPS